MEKQPAMVTLSGELAHNALAAVVQMYQAVVADHARERAMLLATLNAMKAADKEQQEKIRRLEQEVQELLSKCREWQAKSMVGEGR